MFTTIVCFVERRCCSMPEANRTGPLPHRETARMVVRPLRPDFVFMTGWDVVLVPMLLAGCQGGINATSGVVPELTRAIYDLTMAGRIDVAYRLQYTLLRLFDTAFAAGDFPDGFRLAASLRGFDFGVGRQPLTAEQVAKLSAARQLIDGQIRDALTDLGAA